MKLRTSFVTNSSSYSTADIGVDNPVLKAITDKYKDKLFGEKLKSLFNGEDDDFSYIEGEVSAVTGAPKTLDELLENIMTIIEIEQDDCDEDVIKEMLEEIENNKEDIVKSFSYASWEVEDLSIGSESPSMGAEIAWSYSYSTDKNEEEYHVSYKIEDE